jgi:DNA (cytosine-5)-methyltransferase 1
MTRPRLLDLFCGAGGAAVGYARAGFEVVGVDLAEQPNYPFEFHQGDALTYPLDGFDVIHASPPCQRYSVSRTMHRARPNTHPDLVPPTRARLTVSGVPWVIENVPGAPMLPLIKLCGTAFGLGIPGYELRRHRWFEPSPGLWFLSPPCQHSRATIGIYGDHGADKRRTIIVAGHGPDRSGARYFTLAERQQAMGIDWMARDELDQAIPPAYTEYIGRQLLDVLGVAA